MSYDVLAKKNRRSAQAWAGQWEKHKCAAPGCSVMILRRLLMCPLHWRLVPRNTQIELSKAFRSGNRATYLALRDTAIKAVAGGAK